ASTGGLRPRLPAPADRAARRGRGGRMPDGRGDRDADRTGRSVLRDLDGHPRTGGRDARRRVPGAGRARRRRRGPLMLRFLTAGESHGPELLVVVEGLPAGVIVDGDAIDRDLVRRQAGYGRGARSTKIERDHAEIVAGVAGGRTT